MMVCFLSPLLLVRNDLACIGVRSTNWLNYENLNVVKKIKDGKTWFGIVLYKLTFLVSIFIGLFDNHPVRSHLRS